MTVAMITLIFMLLINNFVGNLTNKEMTYSEFLTAVDAGEVSKVVINTSSGIIKMQKNNDLYTYTIVAVKDDTLSLRLYEAGVNIEGEQSSYSILDIVFTFLPLILMVVFFVWMMNRMGGSGGIMGVGKSNAKVYIQKQTGVTFNDVAGVDEAKESISELVDFLHDPQKYVEIGAKLPKGALLVGSPGTGKTLLAKAIAGEANVPFFSLTGSDFVEMFVGVGASRVRDLFKQAQENAPCIIFIDEIDAIGKSRDSRYGGGNDEREQTLNQLLAEMDGFDTSKGLIVLGATNRPETLDPALLRPGRFDRRIIVDKPDLKGRVAILKVHSKDVRMDDTVDLEAIALATGGAVGADLANMVNEAAINAVKNGRKAVNQGDLFEAIETVIAGKEKKNHLMNERDRRIVSYHEVGHALINALQKDAEPVQKITIVPRTMGSLGYVLSVPDEEKYLENNEEIYATVRGLLGGRAAEDVVFGTVTGGCQNDLEKATSYVRSMITMLGMSEKFGPVSLETIEDQYLGARRVPTCGDATVAEVDKEVMRILKQAYAETRSMIADNRYILDQIADYLIKRETITGKEFMDIFHRAQAEQEMLKKAAEEKAAEARRIQDELEQALQQKNPSNTDSSNTDVAGLVEES
ncbi:MAG: ATP-dependent zinc metalloprotease FtsH [Lachnospiraceae bacterium]